MVPDTTILHPLKIDRLSKSFGELKALDSLSFAIEPAQITVLLGPNGSGKTTLFRTICGLLPPDVGSIELFNKKISFPYLSRDLSIGYCPQKLSLWIDLTCREQLIYLSKINGILRSNAEIRAEQTLCHLDLTEKKDVLAGKLSGGMKRRLNLALALVNNPRLLILDEPFNGLDIQSRLLVRKLLMSLAHEKNTTVLLSTHDIADAEQFADQVCIINKGKLIDQNTPHLLKNKIEHKQIITVSISSNLSGGVADLTKQHQLRSDEINIKDNTITLKSKNLDILNQLLNELKTKGLKVTNVSAREASLEDVFVHLTGDSLSNETN